MGEFPFDYTLSVNLELLSGGKYRVKISQNQLALQWLAIPVLVQTILGPTQLTSEWASMKLATVSKPNNTAVDGTLRASPITEHPY